MIDVDLLSSSFIRFYGHSDVYTFDTWISVLFHRRADAAAVAITTTDLVSKSVAIETEVSSYLRMSHFLQI